MSTTKWRGRSRESTTDLPFPRRPSLSPTLIPSSPARDHTRLPDTHQTNGHYVYGLGLSGASVRDEDHEFSQPNRLYIDQSGGAHVVGGRPRSKHSHDTKSNNYHGAQGNRRISKSNKRKNHTRSGSTIDDLANAAIATSPRFAATSPTQVYGGSPIAFTHTRPVTSHVNGYHLGDPFSDRPAKRIRSQRLPSPERTITDGRPRTSHTMEYQSPRPEEAELLLGLRYAWGIQAPPVVPAVVAHTEERDDALQQSVPAEVVTVKKHDSEKDVDGNGQYGSDDSASMPAHSLREESERKPIKAVGHQIDAKEVTDQQQEALIRAKVSAEPGKDATLDNSASMQLDGYREPKAEERTASSLDRASQPAKRPRKIQPEVQAEVCAACLKLQRDGNDEDSTTQWIGCEHCKKWFHTACAGFKDKQEARSVDKFYCKECHGTYGTTTFVRKSSRARTAIDYAGLHEGVVKPSGESSMHHYIQPIKDGQIKYQQDDFARIRPELMTAEFWEAMDGMKRPFVVPACWNPRFGTVSDPDNTSVDNINASPPVDEQDVHFDQAGEILSIPSQSSNDVVDTDTHRYAELEVVDTDQDYLDMVMPRNLTVRRVAELYGPEQPVPVIDVKSQETKGQFTLADWANYYEEQGDKPIRNVISLEVSNSRLGRLIRRPRVVRDIDLEDAVWDHESRSTSNKRPVQFYCLMSVADSYTDFHIDFGGSSVYYHILKGVKTFFFIPPEDRYLKKYEEWCNSDTQNETWLGDLCGGNVTRVDLHEGDTAFIPAGWIHSVWTPEDSLVIGGNFLTRLDYELQLKIANIEKTTRVPLMFRYPFFQKVMWYSLLKYLQDDPVPEEVLRDFHEDDDYRYLRANPIYMDPDDLIRTAEPGTPEFNARVYPKSELKGLPALRDYLYRTARIYADLSVPDINKRQTEAVKASIPKGHGDPMQLIKTFAVWCAWKAGNEKVPEWVHTDFDGLLPELKEREKLRKDEMFRVPPERVSARKSKDSQIGLTILESTTPDRKLVKTPDSDDSAKKRNDLKSSGSRIGCEACRKRRIKCRHKDGDVSPLGTSPAAIRPRTYSNVSVDIPKLASASPVANGFEQTSGSNGTASDFNNTDLAQAALATLHSHSTDSTQPGQSATPTSTLKKGRSKACEECRKSKRRCVHDEYGRVDPAKAAEPSKPRGSTTTKRSTRVSDDPPVRKLKFESEHDPGLNTLSQPDIADAMIDPALMRGDWATALPQQTYHDALDPSLFGTVSYQTYTDYLGPGDADNVVERGDLQHSHVNGMMLEDTNQPFEVNQDVPIEANESQHSPLRETSYSPITVDEIHPHTETDTHSTKLADLPSQTFQHVESTGSVGSKAPSKVVPGCTANERRGSSEHSMPSRVSPNKSRRSSSNTSNTTHQTTALNVKPITIQDSPMRPVSRDSAVVSEADADEKLARELQAAENGLRRRASIRA